MGTCGNDGSTYTFTLFSSVFAEIYHSSLRVTLIRRSLHFLVRVFLSFCNIFKKFENLHQLTCTVLLQQLIILITLQLHHRLNQVEDLRQMEKEPEEFWLQLLKKYLVGAPSVTIRGYPSLQEQQAMAEHEKKRVAEQRDKFDKDGLSELADQLQKATAQNEVSALIIYHSARSVWLSRGTSLAKMVCQNWPTSCRKQQLRMK